MQAYAVQSIHSIIKAQVSPVLVQLATTGPQVRATVFSNDMQAWTKQHHHESSK